MKKIVSVGLILAICLGLLPGGWSTSVRADGLPPLLVSEVLYDSTGSEPVEEWIEVYNPGLDTVDLGNYKVGDEETNGEGEGMLQFPDGASLAGGGVAIVANQASAFFAVYGFNPDYEMSDSDTSVPDMIPYGAWATGSVALSNSGDEVLILDAEDNLVDAVSWGSSTFAFDPSAPDVAAGHSLERNPADVDTDTAADWVDQGTPDPGDVVTSVSDYVPIYDIQYTTDPSGDSPYKDQSDVTTEGIVTARFQYGYFIEDPAGGAWNGLWVHDDANSPNRGDRVRLTGTVKEYNELTELDELTAYQVESNGNPLPDAETLPTGDVSQEQWEGVLVRVENATVTDPDLGYGEWSVDDGSGDVIIDDKGSYTYEPALDDEIDAIVGPLDYTYGDFKIQPRDDADVLLPTEVEIIITEIMQNPAAVDDSAGEWFEVYNAGESAVEMEGWTFRDEGSNSFTVSGSLFIQPDAYLVFGTDGDTATNGGVKVDYVYGSGMSLANGDDEIIIEDTEAAEIDRVAYDGGPVWPDPTGASMMLVDLALDNNDGTNWQETPADLIYGDGDRGTPGCPNDGCPSDLTTIYEIQYTTDPGDDGTYPSLLVGQTVTTTGVVYATYSGRGFCIADKAGPWHGVYVYYPSGTLPNLGDEVQVVGEVQEYYGLTELGNYATYSLLGAGNTPFGPDVVTTADVAYDQEDSEPYESVFVELHQVEVTAGADNHGIWSFTDAAGATGKADDWGYHLEPEVGDTYDVLRGGLIYDFNEYKVMPRDAGDVTSFPDIVVTEIMQNPAAVSDSDGEWFEVYNAGDTAVDLQNWTFRDADGNVFTVSDSLLIQPGEYLVLGRNGDTVLNGGVELDYVYSDFYLSNGDDEVIVEDAQAHEIDRVEYTGKDPWPDPSGASMMLIDLASDNNDGTNWQETPAELTYGDGDRGTPGCPNDGCPWIEVSIPEIQGVDFTSSYSGTLVRTTGVVIGRFEGNLPSGGGNFDGFYLQDLSGDGDPDTSDGVFVNHGTLEISLNVGDQVTVIGTVQEFDEYDDPPPDTETQIRVASSNDVTVEGTTGLPAAVELDPPGDPEAAQLYFEAHEGMLTILTGDSPVVGPTSYGTFFVVPESAGVERVMRGSAHEGKPFGVRRYQRYGNGGPDLIVGSVVRDVDGPLAYTYDNYVVITQPGDDVAVVYDQPAPAEPPIWPSAASDELTVGSFNTYNFDSIGTELTKVADTVDAMGGPLLLGLQEIAVSDVMTDLLMTLGDEGYDYDFANSHPDVGGHGVALLWRSDRVIDVDWSTDYQGCSAVGSESSTEYDHYCDGTGLYPLFSRRPVVATTTVTIEGYPYQVIVIANHFKSKLGGAEADQRRLEQAQFVSDLVDGFLTQDPDANVVVLGDLNDFVDSPPLQALTASGNLTDTFYALAPEERYSYIFGGVSQVLDHILVSPHLRERMGDFAPLHTNADYPFNPYNGDPSVVWRTSDHDPLVSTFRFQPVVPLEALHLDHMGILWHPVREGQARFQLLGEFELPEGYAPEDLSGDLTLSLTISDASGSDVITFTRLDTVWYYRGPDGVGEGLDIRSAGIDWRSDGISFVAIGDLHLPGVNRDTRPAEATVRVSLPVAAPGLAYELVGETYVTFWAQGNRWSYHGW